MCLKLRYFYEKIVTFSCAGVSRSPAIVTNRAELALPNALTPPLDYFLRTPMSTAQKNVTFSNKFI